MLVVGCCDDEQDHIDDVKDEHEDLDGGRSLNFLDGTGKSEALAAFRCGEDVSHLGQVLLFEYVLIFIE